MDSTQALRLQHDDGVFLLELLQGETDNKFNLDVLMQWHSAVQTVQEFSGNTALLIHCPHPKTFSTGIDLEWLFQQPADVIQKFILELENLLLRIAILDVPVVTAINGNCYAGGALIASASDFRYMREDKGRFCFPEVKIAKAFTPVMIDIAQCLPNSRAVYELSLTADAWGGEQCAERGIIDAAVSAQQLFDTALAKTQSLSTLHRPTYSNHKRSLRKAVMGLAIRRGVI